MPLRPTYCNQLSAPMMNAQTSNTFTGPQDLYKGTVAPLQAPTVIPANYFQNGSVFRVTAFGTYSVTGTPTLIFTLTLAATVLATAVTITAGSGVTTLPWKWDTITTIRNTGLVAAGLSMTHGHLTYTPTTLTTAPVVSAIPQTALATVGVDTTVASVLTLNATYSASSASNIVVVHGFVIEELTYN
jgi:hypothetical protein